MLPARYREIWTPLLLEIARRGGAANPTVPVEGKTLFEALADHFELTPEDLSQKTKPWKDTDGLNKWENMVRWARNDLRKQGLVYKPKQGIWALTEAGMEEAAKNGVVVSSATAVVPQADELEFEEGSREYRLHLKIERSQKAVELAKQLRMTEKGRLDCEVCGFNFSDQYGERGHWMIEAHHKKPVSQMKEGDTTKPSDLALICANCHRLIHAQEPWISVRKAQSLVRKRFTPAAQDKALSK